MSRGFGQYDLIVDMRDGGDWSLDLLFAGLVHNLGPENVLMCPRRWKHTEWDDPRATHDWGLERRTLGYTPMNRFVRDRGDHEGFARGMAGLNRIRRIWIDERMESFQYLKALNLSGNIPVVVVAGHDRFWNHSPQFVASLYGDRLEAMLLDNWYESYAKLPFKVRRIGWSTNFDHYWKRPEATPQKDIDVSFIGYNSHPDRAAIIDQLTDEFRGLNLHFVLERRPDELGLFVPKSEYFDVIQRSRMALNLRGAADRGKAMRAYEIPYVGTFMMSQRIEDPGMMEDFREGVHCDYFSYYDELSEKIDYWMMHPGERERIATAGHQQAIGPLSVKERWGDVLRWLGDL